MGGSTIVCRTNMPKHCVHSDVTSCTLPITQQVDSILGQAEKICAARKLRFTESRRRVLELVCRYSQPVGAYSLLDDLRKDGHSAAPPTVYRALDFLLENGLIHRLATKNTYLACAHPQNQHEGLFLVCSLCGETQEVHNSGVIDSINRSAGKHDFKVEHATVEVAGVCHVCGGK